MRSEPIRSRRPGVVGWLLVAAAAGCGGADDADRDAATDALVDALVDAPTDAPIDAPAPVLDDVEPPDCGGDPLVARGGDLAMVVSALAIPAIVDSADLDGDGEPDNKLAAIRALASDPIATGLAAGTLTIPIELFDRGADPDPCLKLALYRGVCAGASCAYTDATPDVVGLVPASIGPGGVPLSRLRAMSTTATAGGAALDLGGGFLLIELPVTDDAILPLPLTVLTGGGTLVGVGPAARLQDLALFGVLQAPRLDEVPAPDIPQIGTTPADSMLDAIYANVLGPLLALPAVAPGCRGADVDVDGDGLEAFCDDDPNDEVRRVTTCIDGDGTRIHDGDGGLDDCTQATVGGVARFRDGISAGFVLSTIPTTIAP